MANTIRIKRSTGSSAPTTLANAELAVSEANQIVYLGIGTGGAGGSATTIVPVGGKGKFIETDTNRTANTILAAPDGSAGGASFRALVSDDIPSLLHTKISDFDTGVRTNKLNELAAQTASVSLNSQTITNLADPVNTQDAATRGFVEATAQGLDVKDSCKVATTGNITISSALNAGDSIDGITLSNGDRVLVKDQSTQSQNGIYVVAASPARADDLAAGADGAGFFTFVEQGSTNADNGFVCTSNKGSAVVGTNNLTIVQFSGAGQITAGNGLDKSGNTLSIDLKSNGGLVIESTEIAVDLGASAITGTLAVADGGTGAVTASNARSNLGLVIGTNVEPHSDKLTELATMGQTTANSLADLTAAEVQILDGATVTTTELNIIDGNTSAVSTTLAAADRLVMNDAGTMKQVALSDLVTFLENESVSSFNIDGGSY